jgi:hypothetical protein
LGAERIWTDDLVRLKAARGQIAPQGSLQILSPSGPSKSTIAELRPDQQTNEEVLKSHGARDRGVFMQLEALFVVDAPDVNSGGVHAECRASGMLYELADEDWEEPLPGESSTEVAKGEAMDAQDGWAAAGLSTPPRPRNAGASPELHVGKPFMSAPSPLKQQPSQESVASLPLTVNTAPVGASVTTPTRNRTKVFKTVDGDAPNTQLSRPKNVNSVPLPPPPRGFRFRPILPEGFEVVVTLALVSGRYYPRLLAHPMLRPIVRDMEGRANEAAARLDGHHLFTLEGILPGFFNASEATQWKPGRSVIVRDVVGERSAMLARMWDTRLQQVQQAVSPAAPEPEPEPVDGAAIVEQSSQGQGQDQDKDKDVTTQHSDTEPPAPAFGISAPMDVQAGPLTQSVPAV